MAKITLKDIISGQQTKASKSYNTDLFKSDTENITENFNKSNYEFISLIDVESTDVMLKETIIGFEKGEAYLINANTTQYNSEKQINISQKWLTLQGFNYFIKEMFTDFDNDFIDDEGKLRIEIQNFYSDVLKNNGIEINYQDVLDLGEYNSEYNCLILSFETDTDKWFITINERKQLSKITRKPKEEKVGGIKEKIQLKSILG